MGDNNRVSLERISLLESRSRPLRFALTLGFGNIRDTAAAARNELLKAKLMRAGEAPPPPY